MAECLQHAEPRAHGVYLVICNVPRPSQRAMNLTDGSTNWTSRGGDFVGNEFQNKTLAQRI